MLSLAGGERRQLPKPGWAALLAPFHLLVHRQDEHVYIIQKEYTMYFRARQGCTREIMAIKSTHFGMQKEKLCLISEKKAGLLALALGSGSRSLSTGSSAPTTMGVQIRTREHTFA